ncbi:DNA-binding response regulator, NarL/FixJ family, contains REC and HTH domains [Amycolatopsis pretoriensis]|uniref:DNA-binding response regulator, NarL/FixJ family, contains REC and HTH domains n=1 Tax=Amycolatopsis pretoriensis TaxID=218821 RepID=A0A1H5RDE7_9PSEU|nr:response regulator transcription factor [Amycolatopsis pretoriensis]SEF36375.1 DNA-binding response regulator, NarL/FixJ family, contains REC and HTH domains [Amycolatopsis pretoriensis]
MTIAVLVVDDQQVVREGLVALLGLLDDVDVVGSAANGEQALALAGELDRLDVVLMDLNMPVLNGVETTERLTREHPGVAVLVLTTYSDDESIAGALAAGAKGYLTKDAGRHEIGAALRAVVAGQLTFGADVSRQVAGALSGVKPRKESLPDGLTAREAEVLGLIAAGLSNAKIAAELFIGEATVKTHINNAFAKIGVRNRVEALRYAERHGLQPKR